MQKININISNKQINRDEQLISYSRIDNSQKGTYKELIDFNLKRIFNNNDSLEKNLVKLKSILNENNIKKNIKLIRLKKGTEKVGKFVNHDKSKKDKLENLIINIEFENRMCEKFNILTFFIDLEKTNSKEEINIFLKRIEFLDNSTNKINSNSNYEFNFLVNEINSTLILDIYELIENEQTIFDDDDFNKDDDKLLISKWFDYLGLLDAIFNKSDKDSSLYNELLINNIDNNKLILCSRTKIDNWNNFELFSNEQDLSDYKFKKIVKNEYKDFKEMLNKKNKEIKEIEFNSEKEIKDLENEINIFQKESNKLENEKNKLENEKYKIENEINNLNNKKIKEQENLKKEIDKIKTKLDKQKNNKKNDEFNKKIQKLNDENKKYNQKINNEIMNFEKEIKKFDNEIINKNNEYLSIVDKLKKRNEKIKQIMQLINDNKEIYEKISNFLKEMEIKKYEFFYEINKDETKFENENKFNFDQEINNIFEKRLASIGIIENWKASATKIKRLFFALRQLNQGYYKNFNLFKSIKNPSNLPEILEKQIPEQVKNKYKLNKKQEEAVKKSININDIFYLQGPPGTGKTQTLCAISESIISDNKNILMCSSTHEAINNFLERLHDNNKDNPNLIIYKYRLINDSNKKNDSLFSEENLYKNFKDSIFNYTIKDSQKNNLDELLNRYINSYGYNKPEIFKKYKLPKSYAKIILENADYFNQNIDLIKQNEDEYWFPFNNIYGKINKTEINEQDIFKTIDNFIQNKTSDDEKKQIQLFDEIINEAKIEDLDDLFSNDLIKKLKNNCKKDDDELSTKMKNIRDRQLNDDNWEKQFLNYIFNNNLINVIGSTTTSKQEIEINGKLKHLFNDYEIDLLMIDEISKSNTPEIISKSILAKKIILCGDYLQLPPALDFSTNSEIERIIDGIKNELNHKDFEENYYYNFISEKIEESKDNQQKLFNNIKKEFEKLFKTSFFVNQVLKMKSSNNPRISYTFLDESHRFSGKILKIVNHIYKGDESLKSVSDKNIKTYNLNINNKNLDSELVMLDILNNKEYFSKYHNINILNDWSESFDQTGKCIPLNQININNNEQSTYNQYSALIIIDIVKKILKQNKERFNDFNTKIGIITLTKAQKNIVKNYLHLLDNKEDLNKIKVDTIDNFQGREEEIIIVDFIRGEHKVEDHKLYKPNSRNLNFLSEIERINVAISRAKSKLILVGYFSEYLNQVDLKGNYGNLFKKYFNEVGESDNSYILLNDKEIY